MKPNPAAARNPLARLAAVTARYIASRRDGTAPLATVYWRDMVLIGTGLVALTLGIVVLLAATDAHSAFIVAAYVANWPYNIFITVAVWRASRAHPAPTRAAARLTALLWLAFATVV